MTKEYIAYSVATTCIVVCKRIHFHYRAWQHYIELNSAALRESGRPRNPSKTWLRGGMSFWQYMRDPLSRMIYGAKYEDSIHGDGHKGC